MENQNTQNTKTHFHPETPLSVQKILEKARKSPNPPRLRIFYGDQTTGRDWMEEYSTTGTTKLKEGDS